MIAPRFRVTYDLVTDESAESGFLDRDGHRVAALIGVPTPGVEMTLRQAMRIAWPTEDSGRWFAEEGRMDYKGRTERRSIHPPRSVTSASYGRLACLLGAS